MTQERLARRSGVSARTIRYLEAGVTREPQIDSVRLMADALGLRGADRAMFEAAARTVPSAPPAGSPSSSPRQLPADIVRFTGRRVELGILHDLLAEAAPTSRRSLIVALVGSPGAGKTALAVHWSHEIADRFAEGQLYADLRGFDSGPAVDPAAVLDGFLRALGAPPEQIPAGVDARSALFRTMTSGRRILVVADNAGDSEHVRPLLPGPGNLLIVTSRRQLRGLVALHDGRRLTVDRLPHADATTLLARTLGPSRLAGQNEAAAELVELCAGLPLALQIAAEQAARQPERPLADLVVELRHEQFRLGPLATGDDPTTDLGAVFSWSYGRLDPEVAHAFRLIGIEPAAGEISLPAAAALLGLEVATTRSRLDRLLDGHLIEARRLGRYGFHDLLRAYAAGRAADEEPRAERCGAVNRLLDWYLHTAWEAVRLQWFGTRQQRNLDLVAPEPPVTPLEFDSARQALEWLEEHRVALVAGIAFAARARRDLHASLLAEVTRRFLRHQLYLDDLVNLAGTALPAIRRLGDGAAEADLIRDLGIADALRRDYDTAMDRFRESLGISRAAGYRLGEADSLHDLGHVLVRMDRHQEAKPYYLQSLAVRRRIGDRIGEALELNAIAVADVGLGRHDSAISLCRQALGILSLVDDPRARAHTLDTLGAAVAASGDHGMAVASYGQALAIVEELGDAQGEGFVRLHLGRALRDAGDLPGAMDQWRRALGILRALRDLTAEDVMAEIGRLDGS